MTKPSNKLFLPAQDVESSKGLMLFGTFQLIDSPLREIDDLRRLVSHFIEPRTTDTSQVQTNRAPPEITRLQQHDLPLQHLAASCPPQLLPWLLNNGITPPSPTANTLKLLENLEAARNVNQVQLNNLWSSLQNNTVVPTSSSANSNQMELSAVAASMNNGALQCEHWLIICDKTRLFLAHASAFIDHQVSSETSSSPSSTNTQV